jgi:uncharacterized iron-regulated membrane protein
MELAAPVLISPPTGSGNLWPARSDAANRPLRASVFVDGTSGKVVARDTFAERPLVDRLVGYGVAAHEGQLFGALNQVINLFVALGLMLLAISSAVLWWRRRPAGQLGAPRSLPGAPAAFAFVALVVLLGLLLPLFGLSLLAVLIVERMALRRMRGPSRCLGLSSA